jgi:hypothetical protein
MVVEWVDSKAAQMVGLKVEHSVGLKAGTWAATTVGLKGCH